MVAEVAGHQAFDGFVGVEETIRPQQERQPRSKGCGRNRDIRQQVACPERRRRAHAWQYYGREWISIC